MIAEAAPGDDPFLVEARAHDEAVAARDVVVWIGAEPTFTRRDSQEPVWLFQAEGGDKLAHARALLRALAPRLGPRAALCRVAGRQFPEEPAARFAFGARFPRDGFLHGFTPSGDLERPVSEIANDLPDEPAPEPAALAALPEAPSVGRDEAWLTVTPDPGVVEVNMAPARDLTEFLGYARAVYAAAGEAGLSAVRYRYNGRAGDSGGGGQITLGGDTAQTSPFFTHPWLLPSLLRYANRHPSLSYLFASECVGGASQGPRPDEGVRERFDELPAALDWLDARIARDGGIAPEDLWLALSALLVDGSGNAHRAEINIEKLSNPYLPGRGTLGLAEFRALRMPPTPERLTATAALLRALAAMLAAEPCTAPLIEWGAALHDRWALPFFLFEDLRAVLADLARAGLCPGPRLVAELLTPVDERARVTLEGATLALTPALEFWPLLGDVASQERAGARLVDSSTERLEARVTFAPGVERDPGVLAAGDRAVPLHRVEGADGARVALAAVRYRTFLPRPGLHPGLPVTDPLVLTWTRAGRAVEIALHGWIPGGGGYDGLPADALEAARRRAERTVVTEIAPREAPPLPRVASGLFAVDLRRPAAP